MKDLHELNEFIESKNREVSNLQEKIAQLERKRDIDLIKWQVPQAFVVDDLRMGLPYPRLEMRLQKEGYQTAWVYGIVCRRYECNDNKEQCFFPLNKTTTTATIEQILSYEDKLPSRDGTHIRVDMVAFRMRAYLVCVDHLYLEEISEMDIDGIIQLAKERLIKD